MLSHANVSFNAINLRAFSKINAEISSYFGKGEQSEVNSCNKKRQDKGTYANMYPDNLPPDSLSLTTGPLTESPLMTYPQGLQ